MYTVPIVTDIGPYRS